MSRKYKFDSKEGLYFVSFATINWIDIFVRDEYFMVLVNSLAWCQREKGMEIHAWCMMPSHMHLVFGANNQDPGNVLKSFKTFTSKAMRKIIEENSHESRREWILTMMKKAGQLNSNVKDMQFWQQHNKPIELWTPEVIDQKIDYIHNNPIVSGFVSEAHHWKYSSAIDYSGGKGLLEISFA